MVRRTFAATLLAASALSTASASASASAAVDAAVVNEERTGLRRGQSPPLDDFDETEDVLLARGYDGLPVVTERELKRRLSNEDNKNAWDQFRAARHLAPLDEYEDKDNKAGKDGDTEYADAEDHPMLDRFRRKLADDSDAPPVIYRADLKTVVDSDSILELRGTCVRWKPKRVQQGPGSLVIPGTEPQRQGEDKKADAAASPETKALMKDFDFEHVCQAGSAKEEHDKCGEAVMAVMTMGTAALGGARSCGHQNLPCRIPQVEDVSLKVSNPPQPFADGGIAAGTEGGAGAMTEAAMGEWKAKSVKFNGRCGLEIEFEPTAAAAAAKAAAEAAAKAAAGIHPMGVAPGGGHVIAGAPPLGAAAMAGGPQGLKELEITIVYSNLHETEVNKGGNVKEFHDVVARTETTD